MLHKYKPGDKVLYKTYLITILYLDGYTSDRTTPVYRITGVPDNADISVAAKAIAFENELSECLIEDGNITYA